VIFASEGLIYPGEKLRHPTAMTTCDPDEDRQSEAKRPTRIQGMQNPKSEIPT